VTRVEYVVVLVVRVLDGRAEMLVAKRARGVYMGDTWQLITGGIEPGEAAWQAALRELREETDLVPDEFYRLSTLTSFYRVDNDSLNTAPMFCAVVGRTAVPSLNHELQAFEWMPIPAARERLMWPSDHQAVDEVVAVVLGDGPAKPHMKIVPPQQ
jgi:dATP pyrophosphohydrolase